jgi:hypothetical protein
MRLRRARTPLPPLLCRWDLDKTYLRSEFDTLGQLWRTAWEKGVDKIEVPGVADVIKGLKAAGDRRGRAVAVHFISASPPQIGKAIRDKLALDGVPYDGIAFKDQLQNLRRGKLRNLREHVGFKLTELLRGRAGADPAARELLFGDDWESDPLTYSLYADVIAARLERAVLEQVLARIGVDPATVPGILEAAAAAVGGDRVDRIFINLERRTPIGVFRLYGPRVVPSFNYFQTSVVLAADGWMDAEDVLRVARALTDAAGFTPRRLENSLADLVRRGLVLPQAADRVARPLRKAGVLPVAAGGPAAWIRRLTALRRRRPAALASTAAVDYTAILTRLAADQPEVRARAT